MADERKIRVLVGKCGLDGHDRGVRIIARAFQEAGMEVIYTGLHQTPEAVVEAALQEDVEVIGLSVLSAAHMALFPRVMELLRENDAEGILVMGGGIIPDDDKAALQAMGVGELFRPGEASLDAMVEYVFREVARRREEAGNG